MTSGREDDFDDPLEGVSSPDLAREAQAPPGPPADLKEKTARSLGGLPGVEPESKPSPEGQS